MTSAYGHATSQISLIILSLVILPLCLQCMRVQVSTCTCTCTCTCACTFTLSSMFLFGVFASCLFVFSLWLSYTSIHEVYSCLFLLSLSPPPQKPTSSHTHPPFSLPSLLPCLSSRLRDDFTISLPPNRHHQRDGTSSLTRKPPGGVVSPLDAMDGGSGSSGDTGTRLSLPPIDDNQPSHLRPR